MSESQGTGLSPDDQENFDWRAPPARVSVTPGRTPASTDRSEGELPPVAPTPSTSLAARFRRVSFLTGILPGTPDASTPTETRALEENVDEEDQRGETPLSPEELFRIAQASRTINRNLFILFRQRQEEQRRRRMEDAELLAQNTFSISPYENPLNLASKTGLALYEDGAAKVRNTCGGDSEDVQPLLSDLTIRAAKCRWGNILNFTIGGVDRNLLTHHGHFSDADFVESDLDYLDMTDSPGHRDTTHPRYKAPPVVPMQPDGKWDNDPNLNATYRANVRFVLNRRMLHDCLQASLSQKYKKSLSAVLPSMHQDGVKLLWYILSHISANTCLTARDLKLKLQNLDPADHGTNIKTMHNSFDVTCSRITSANDTASDTDKMIYLFEAHKKIDNQKFQINVSLLEAQWSNGTLTTPQALRTQIETHYNTLVATNSWTFAKKQPRKRTGKRANAQEGEPTALVSDGDSVEEQKRKFKAKHEAWKFTRSSGQTTLQKNNKTWRWCTGPGHFGIPMWVAHEPSTCTNKSAGRGGRGRGAPAGNTTAGRGSGAEPAGRGVTGTAAHARGLRTNIARDAFRAHVTSSLENLNGSFGDDASSIVDTIVNHMYSSS